MRPLKHALRSSVLIVAHPKPSDVNFGADFETDFSAATDLCAEHAFPVVALPADGDEGPERALRFMRGLDSSDAGSQVVIIQNGASAEDIRRLVNEGNAFRVLPSFDDTTFERTIQEALEEHALALQNAKLLQSVREQNERLTRLSAELEDRVEKRERKLEEMRERLDTANARLEALHRALVAVHRARSAPEMERLLNEALHGALSLAWIRVSLGVRVSGATAMREAQARLFSVHSAPLLRGKESLGEIAFARALDKPFARDETSFLQQVAEAAALAIDRLVKLEQSETLKRQWEATFDAIDEPVAMLDDDRSVARANRAFAAAARSAPEAVIGRKCYEALFGRTAPCEGCELGANFPLAPAKTAAGVGAIYRVFSQGVSGREGPYVNVYRDVAAQLRLESQILESAKMAELGTIGSSIAHELNNPLGGMLSFLQLMKMDLKNDDPWTDDVAEMEKGARRCSEIVRNLLGFARKPSADPDSDGEVDLRDVLSQALKITELQTRAMGVLVRESLPEAPAVARGQRNLLSQAIRFFLQGAQDAIVARAKREAASPRPEGTPRYRGEISVSIEPHEKGNRIRIEDNGWRPDSDFTAEEAGSAGMGLSVALDLVTAHGGRTAVELKAGGADGARASIYFPPPNA